jgi:integrase
MAFLALEGGTYHIYFRYGGRQFHKSLKTPDEKAANAWKGQIEQTLHDLERGRLQLPANADLWEFIKTDGKREQRPQVESRLTLDGLFRWYFASLPDGAKETKTRKVETIHANHAKRLLGAKRELDGISGHHLQEEYVNRRATEKWHGRPIRPQTVRKEIETLQMVWNRARRNGVAGVHLNCPSSGLKYPKRKLKPPFQTWGQIEAAVARGGLSEVEVKELWDSLFLDLDQVADVLRHARAKTSRRRYFYPLMVFVAHTGARLSECMRSRVEDFRFEDNQLVIREKKRDQGGETFRYVNLSPTLRDTMKEWFADGHPGGAYAICRVANKPFHEQTLHDDFEWFMAGSKWEVLRGFHVFRHSFASNLAREGVDQRTIDELMGHQTEEMRKRYRHLFPEQRENAVRRLFG